MTSHTETFQSAEGLTLAGVCARVCVWLTGSVPSCVACLPLRNQCIWFLKNRKQNVLLYQIG